VATGRALRTRKRTLTFLDKLSDCQLVNKLSSPWSVAVSFSNYAESLSKTRTFGLHLLLDTGIHFCGYLFNDAAPHAIKTAT
jgi:hypothetical protein